MPLLILIALVILGRVLTLGTPNPLKPDQNVLNGLGFMWNPQDVWAGLKNAELWLAASGQIFFTLTVGFGVICCYASYLKKKDDVVLSALTAAAANEFCEVGLGGLITVPAAFVFLGTAGIVGMGTFGLGFNVLPSVFAQMPFGNFFAFEELMAAIVSTGRPAVLAASLLGIAFLAFALARAHLLIFWGRKPLAEELDARPGQDPDGLIQYSLNLLTIMAFSDGMLSPSQFWGSLFGVPQMDTIGAFLSQTIAGAPDPILDGARRWQSIAACVGCAVAGIGWAVIRVGRQGHRGEFEQPALESATGVLREAFFVEQGIDRVLVRPLRGFSRLLLAGVVEARILDRVVVSGGAGVARRMVWSGLRRLQNGRLQSYAMLGVIALLLSVAWLAE